MSGVLSPEFWSSKLGVCGWQLDREIPAYGDVTSVPADETHTATIIWYEGEGYELTGLFGLKMSNEDEVIYPSFFRLS